MAEAMQWATRAMTIALEMVIPGLIGQWADKKLGTSFLTLLGFALGLSAALYHLVSLARQTEQARHANRQESQTSGDPIQNDDVNRHET